MMQVFYENIISFPGCSIIHHLDCQSRFSLIRTPGDRLNVFVLSRLNPLLLNRYFALSVFVVSTRVSYIFQGFSIEIPFST